jgi:hypothetical protein
MMHGLDEEAYKSMPYLLLALLLVLTVIAALIKVVLF